MLNLIINFAHLPWDHKGSLLLWSLDHEYFLPVHIFSVSPLCGSGICDIPWPKTCFCCVEPQCVYLFCVNVKRLLYFIFTCLLTRALFPAFLPQVLWCSTAAQRGSSRPLIWSDIHWVIHRSDPFVKPNFTGDEVEHWLHKTFCWYAIQRQKWTCLQNEMEPQASQDIVTTRPPDSSFPFLLKW